MASMVGAPCWPLKYMISDAHDTRLPGTWPKISCVILCVRFSANEYGGLSERTGDCSLHVNERSKTRADFSALSKASAEPPWALATAGPRMCIPPAAARAAVKPAAPSHVRRVTSLMSAPPSASEAASARVWSQASGPRLLLLHKNVVG